MNKKHPTEIVEISFFELLLAIAKRKKFVISLTLVSLVLVTAIVFIIPRKWESKALIEPIEDNATTIQLNANILSNIVNECICTNN